jgi:hypothetical protein
MASGDSAARIRSAKEKLMMRNSPGASEDARIIARKQGAKTSKQVETKAKLIAQNRVNDAQKNLTRAKMQGADAKLMRSVNPPTFKPPKETVKAKITTKSKASKSLKGDKAIEEIRKRTSPKGMKKYDKGAKKALEKKYPGLYKKSK